MGKQVAWWAVSSGSGPDPSPVSSSMCITVLGLLVLCWNVLEDLEACKAEMQKCECYIIFTFWTIWVPCHLWVESQLPPCAIRVLHVRALPIARLIPYCCSLSPPLGQLHHAGRDKVDGSRCKPGPVWWCLLELFLGPPGLVSRWGQGELTFYSPGSLSRW